MRGTPNIMALANMVNIMTTSHMMSQLPTDAVVLLSINITMQNGDINIFPTDLLKTFLAVQRHLVRQVTTSWYLDYVNVVTCR